VVRQSESPTPSGDEAGSSALHDRHPTCADFRDASLALLRQALSTLRPSGGAVCEVGCGDSLLIELVLDGYLGRDVSRIDLIDNSPGMLSYSARNWSRHPYPELHVADARDLPLEEASVNVLLSSLGDPYNDRAFWMEVGRVLKEDGIAIFTTPSYDWAHCYRDREELPYATFQLKSGRSVRVASIILPPDDQTSLIEGCGDPKLVVEDRYYFRIGQLGKPRERSKVMVERGPSASVVDCYIVRRS
jgi:SAM-dependent methyltransferase